MAKKFKSPWTYNGIQIETDINDIVTDEEEILKLCKAIDTAKTSAIENLSSMVIKDAFCAIPHIISRLLNLSLHQGIFPEKWKQADIIPIFKGGDPSDVNNYRPISLLPLPGKLLEKIVGWLVEKIVHNRLSNFLELHDILNIKQGGFRTGHSTINTIAEFTDDIFNNLNNSQCTMTTFIDLKKAFDTVNHSLLLKKLDKLGIRGKPHNWLTSYLNYRTQRTLANGNISNILTVGCGVPQGSILGPTLFLLYINDIDVGLTESTVHLFADDTVVYSSGETMYSAHPKLQTDLRLLTEWCGSNQLTINAKKTKNMLFGSKKFVRIKELPKIDISSQEIQFVDHYKYLGVILDQNLNYQKHLKETFRLASHKVYLLSRIRKFITNDAALLIYKTKILPYLDYGDVLYLGSCNKSLSKLQSIQNRALRICISAPPRTSTNNTHNIAQMPELKHRRTAHLRNVMFKRKYRAEYIDYNPVRTRLHDATLMTTYRANYSAVERSVSYKGAREWNNLSIQDRNIQLYETFKFRQKKWLYSKIPDLVNT